MAMSSPSDETATASRTPSVLRTKFASSQLKVCGLACNSVVTRILLARSSRVVGGRGLPPAMVPGPAGPGAAVPDLAPAAPVPDFAPAALAPDFAPAALAAPGTGRAGARCGTRTASAGPPRVSAPSRPAVPGWPAAGRP